MMDYKALTKCEREICDTHLGITQLGCIGGGAVL